MSQYNMTPLPDLETGNTIEQIYRNQKTIKNWLFQLNEQLRYNLYNMEVENLTQATVDQLTSVSEDVKAQLQVLDGKITAAVTAADGRFAELQIDIDGITTRVGDAEGNISSLQQTATSITSTVQDMEGNISVLQQTATSLTTAIQNAEGDISSLQQTASSLTSRVSDAEDNISSVEQTAEKIDWVVASGTSASNFSLTSRMASLISDEVHIVTDQLEISSISNGGNVYVQCNYNGVDIYPGSGDVTIGNSSGEVVIQNNLTVNSTAWAGYGGGNAFVGYGNIVCSDYQMGAYSARFTGWCYAPSWENGSDRSLKENIQELSESQSCALILGLKPVSYHYKQTTQSHRAQTRPLTLAAALPATIGSLYQDVNNNAAPESVLHFGFIAQDVQEELVTAGFTEGNPLVASRKLNDTDETGTLSLNYIDIIAPLVKTVQWMEARITALEGTV